MNVDTGNTLLDNAMFDRLLSLLSYMAQSGRKKIRSRQKQGVAIAKSKGTYEGRKIECSLDSNNPSKQLIYLKVVEMLEQGCSKNKIVD